MSFHYVPIDPLKMLHVGPLNLGAEIKASWGKKRLSVLKRIDGIFWGDPVTVQPERKRHIPPKHSEKGALGNIIIFLFVAAPGFRCSALVLTCSPGMWHNSEDERRGVDRWDQKNTGSYSHLSQSTSSRAALVFSGVTIDAQAVQQVSAGTDDQWHSFFYYRFRLKRQWEALDWWACTECSDLRAKKIIKRHIYTRKALQRQNRKSLINKTYWSKRTGSKIGKILDERLQ